MVVIKILEVNLIVVFIYNKNNMSLPLYVGYNSSCFLYKYQFISILVILFDKL